MGNNYDKFLQRMIEYRDAMKLSQKEVSGLFGKTQSQLSKMELGKTVISYEILESLQNAGWDIDYMITGKPGAYPKEHLTEYLDENIGEAWKDIKEILLWVVKLEFGKSGGFPDKDSQCEYELAKLLLDGEHQDSVLAAIRDYVGISQIGMAEKLGVNIKKYRDLEKGRNRPDAELLVKIYEIAWCRPGIFFCTKDAERYLLDELWNKLNGVRQKEAFEYLNSTIRLYKAQTE